MDFAFTDWSGDWNESYGYDSLKTFEIRVSLFPSPRTRDGELSPQRQTDRYSRTKRNRQLLDAAVEAAEALHLEKMQVQQMKDLTDRASIRRLNQ